MESLKKERTLSRKLFSRAKTELLESLKSKFEIDEVQTYFEYLSEKAENLFKVDYLIKEKWLESDNLNEDEFEKDCDVTETYKLEWLKVKNKYEKICNTHKSENPESKFESASMIGSGSANFKRRIRLPKLDVPTFDGSPKNWIKFWGIFKKIHTDENIDDDDKFAYLLQSTEIGSPARALIESFPPSSENYQEAVKQLKNRYARDELLIEIYIRELLALVLDQAKGNSMTLASLYDRLKTQLRALETLGVTSDKYAAMLYPLVESALPADLLRVWERQRCEDPKDTDILEKLLKFVRLEVESEERIQITRRGIGEDNIIASKVPTAACLIAGEVKNTSKESTGKEVKLACIWCEKTNHSSLECYKAQRMSLERKNEIIEKKKACYVCLKVGHNGKKCRAFTKCLICAKRHCVLLCTNISNASSSKKNITQITETVASTSQSNSGSNAETATTYLQTLEVKIGHLKVRAFIDTGAQRSYIRRDIIEKLQLKPVGEECLSHSLFGAIETIPEKHQRFDITVESFHNDFLIKMTVLDKRQICGFIPQIRTSTVLYDKLKRKNIILSDSGRESLDIGLLIGADYAGHILTNLNVYVEKDIFAIKTKLGWTVQGVTYDRQNSVVNSTVCLNDISQLWDLDVLGIEEPEKVMNKQEKEMELMEDFRKSISINSIGRYEVKLPWKLIHPVLLENKDLAYKRLQSTTKRLESLNELKNYDSVFKEWLHLGIIELESDESIPGHYIPHQAVIKNSSATTRIRPVFDASAKDSNGNSINSSLEKGLNFLELIPIMMTRFRLHKIGLTADIKKAFLQISLPESDRVFLRFLWWADADMKKTLTYRHCRVVFGLTCSPFLLAATIRHHLEQIPTKYQATAQLLNQSFYVDNCVVSLETVEEAEKFIKESCQILSERQFELRGWVTAPNRCEGAEDQDCITILGLNWDTGKDQLSCNLRPIKEIKCKVTKRELLSLANKVFDPIGFTCPVTLIPKLLLQKCWSLNVKWDAALPEDIYKKYVAWLKHIHLLSQCAIPRRLTVRPIKECKKSLHIFSDASAKAFAACVFLRAESVEEVTVQLVIAKSRVAPVKPASTPRLELIAALISARLFLQAKKALQIEDYDTYFWTDSSVALAWITHDGDWNTFVKNRVTEIRQHTKLEDWRHISGTNNPADLPSRGCHAQSLLEGRWWLGPEWLKREKHDWPITQDIDYDEEEINKEKKKRPLVDNVSTKSKAGLLLTLNDISKFSKIVRIVSWIRRFKNNCTNSNPNRNKKLTKEEIEIGRKLLLSVIQQESFDEENIKKTLKNAEVYKDDDGMMRIKTRLTLCNENEDFKYPVLLPGKHPLVRKLVMEKHIQLQHAGVNIMTSILRETYWIISMKKLVRDVISSCVICKRYTAQSYQTPVAPLPKNRVVSSAVFEVTGIDTAGPMFLKSGEKCWFLLFTCAVYRAIHLELLTSLSTECFIMALRRFIARRGRCRIIYTDNGTNFVGASNMLTNINWESIQTSEVSERIKWIFNPPAAPWWGGWWERLIQMVKKLLRRNLGNAVVTYVELETLLIDIEALVNSRPLTCVEENNTLKPLTPAHFLQPITTSEVPDLDAIDEQNLNLRMRYIHKLREDLRQRFKNEYLSLLIGKTKVSNAECEVGHVVLVETEGKRHAWPIGIVLEVYTGRDGFTRVAKVKTKYGERVRPVQKLYLLEMPTYSAPQKESEVEVGDSNTKDEGEIRTRSGRVVRPTKRLDL